MRLSGFSNISYPTCTHSPPGRYLANPSPSQNRCVYYLQRQESKPIYRTYIMLNKMESKTPTLFTEDLYKTLLDSIFDAVYVVDIQGNIIYWNESCARLTGYSAPEMVGHPFDKTPVMNTKEHDASLPSHLSGLPTDFSSSGESTLTQQSRNSEHAPESNMHFGPDPAKDRSALGIVLETGMPGTWKGYLTRKNGQRLPIESRISAVRNENSQIIGAVEVLRDISAHVALEEAHRHLLQLSRKDRLTGLYNRAALGELLKAEIERARRYQQLFSVAMMDIDHFKRINDRYGHDAGDKVLAQIGAILDRNLRQPDMVGRWGGEEFLIMVPNNTAQGAAQLADRIRQYIKKIPETLIPEPISASFGVSQLQPDQGSDQLLYQADMALYQAKNQGRDRVVIN